MNKKKIKKKNLILKQWQIMIIIAVLVSLIVSSSIMILTGISKKQDSGNVLYSYQINNSINYKVNLEDNSFFDTDSLPMDGIYIADLIKNIDVNFIYYYTNSNKLDLSYTYDIIANLKGTYGSSDTGNNAVWNKQYVLEKAYTETLTENNLVNLDKTLSIDFKYYKNIVDQFKIQLNLAIDASLEIIMTVKLDSSDGTLADVQNLSINIPLSSSTLKITKTYTEINQKSIYDSTSNSKPVKLLRIVIGTIILVISVVLSVLSLYYLVKITKKSEYDLKLKKIFKNFGEIIVEVSNELDYKDMHIINVKKFEDMIDLEEELRIPILHYEKEKDFESWFMIVKEKQLYRYILKVEKIEDISNPLKKNKKQLKNK